MLVRSRLWVWAPNHPLKTTNKPRGTWGRSGSAELVGTSGDEDGLGRTSGEEDELGGASRDTSGLPFAANGDGLVLAADSGRVPSNAGLGELQTPVNSILIRVDYSVTIASRRLHGRARKHGTRRHGTSFEHFTNRNTEIT